MSEHDVVIAPVPRAKRGNRGEFDALAARLDRELEPGGAGARLPRAYSKRSSANSYAAAVQDGRIEAWSRSKWGAVVRKTGSQFYVWVFKRENDGNMTHEEVTA